MPISREKFEKSREKRRKREKSPEYIRKESKKFLEKNPDKAYTLRELTKEIEKDLIKKEKIAKNT